VRRDFRAISADRHTAPAPRVSTRVVREQQRATGTFARFDCVKSSSQTSLARASAIGISKDSGDFHAGAVVLMSGNSALFPKAAYAAVGTINAAIVALAKAFSDRGIADGVQLNSVLPGPVMTGRRRCYLEHWAPLHGMSVEEATAKFPAEAGISR
jgi:NAD(P)-dependent dehydrogenase (short-subunit alcohol dehydrogenase family)